MWIRAMKMHTSKETENQILDRAERLISLGELASSARIQEQVHLQVSSRRKCSSRAGACTADAVVDAVVLVAVVVWGAAGTIPRSHVACP